MKLTNITSKSRRDFYGIYECEFCGHTEEGYGYDDENFYDNVIPDMECSKCKKSTLSENGNIDKITPMAPRDIHL